MNRIQRSEKAIDAPMNFQLPPNSAIKSAARSATVRCACSSSLALRETRWRRRSSVRRRRWVSAVRMPSAMSGFLRRKERNSARGKTASRESALAVASAERGFPSRSDISPKNSPLLISASVVSWPSVSFTLIRTRPVSIRYMASPGSPRWNTLVPASTSRIVSRAHNSAAASSSSARKRGTDRKASIFMKKQSGRSRC